ncbi:hypothetical protein [Natrinema sp. 1APR25-10V2]|uniref:hypothetical protein n=1 Tax=Natrinema sp. 1APR25-10V2 TaxID=2951081 RepID=UPI0028760FAB|nr:hypothetical protein [Natrinema sp. 1APR25-10V2]MDS0475164.1 hypothetical protein [Natrinema sp. 1APR25-10V2]
MDDFFVLKNSDALRDLRQEVSESTGRTVSDVLPLPLEFTTSDEELNALNPSLAVSLLKDPTITWQNTAPQDLGVAVAGVIDEPESGVNSGVSVETSDGTSRIPISAGAVTLHDQYSSASRRDRFKHRKRGSVESDDNVQYRLFSYGESNEVVQSQLNDKIPDTSEQASTISIQSSKSPVAVAPEVVESYQSYHTSSDVNIQSIHGEIGCTTCQAVIPAICAGVSQLGFYGCASRCVPYATTYPVLTGGCAVFCRYVTTVEGAMLCAASPAIICGAAFGC